MGKTKEYYSLFARTFWDSAREHAGLREFLVALFCLFIGASIFLATKGIDAMNKEVATFIAFTVAPLGILAFLFIIGNLIWTPVKIHFDQKNSAAKLHQEQSDQIAELKNKWESELAKSNFVITGSVDVDSGFGKKIYLGIVNNHKNHTITVNSISLKRLQLKIPGDLSLHQLINMAWREFNRQPIILLPNQPPYRVAIAEATFREIVFLLGERDQPHPYSSRRLQHDRGIDPDIGYAMFEIEIWIDGIIDDGRAIETEIVRGKVGWTSFRTRGYYDSNEDRFIRPHPPEPTSSISIYEVTYEPKTTNSKANSTP